MTARGALLKCSDERMGATVAQRIGAEAVELLSPEALEHLHCDGDRGHVYITGRINGA